MPAHKKRSDQRLGHTGKAYHENIDRPPNTTEDILGPEPPDWLTGFALEWYDSLRISGQAIYYTESDWTSALVVARGVMDFIRNPRATMLTAVLQGFGMLGATEGARRSMQIELGAAAGVSDPDAERGEAETEEWQGKLRAVPDA